jgi:hypothetical protein
MKLQASAALSIMLTAVLSVPVQASDQTPAAVGTRFVATETARLRIDFGTGVDRRDLAIKVSGRGRVSGAILRKVGTYEQEGYRPDILDLYVRQCDRPGCNGRRSFGATFFYAVDDVITGLWDLYVVADGAPVTVSFTARTERTVLVTRPVEDQITTLEPGLVSSDDRRVWSAGDFTKLEQVDLGLLGMWARGESGHNTAFGDCFHPRTTSLSMLGDAAFVPGCPAGDGDPWVNEASERRPSGTVFTSIFSGDYPGIGGWYSTSASIDKVGAVAYWIDF